MTLHAFSAVTLACIALVCAGMWLDAIEHDDPPSAIRTARNKCAAWSAVALAAIVWGMM